MIDAKKVRMMTRIAVYEQGEGKEARRIQRYSRRTYMDAKLLVSFFALSIAYLLAAGLYCFRYIDDIFLQGFGYDYRNLLIRLLAGYLVFLTAGMLITGRIYRKRYESMVDGMKRYDYSLYHLKKYLDQEEKQ